MVRIHLPSSEESANEIVAAGWECILRQIVSCLTADDDLADLNRDLLLLKPRRPKKIPVLRAPPSPLHASLSCELGNGGGRSRLL